MAGPTGLYTDEMDVYSATYTASQSGGAIRTPAVKATAQPCRIQDTDATGSIVGMQEGMVVTHKIFTDYANCVNGDEIRAESKVYRVIGTPIHRRAIGNMDGYYLIEAMEVVN